MNVMCQFTANKYDTIRYNSKSRKLSMSNIVSKCLFQIGGHETE